MILQRVIKKSESIVNGLKSALWGSTCSLKSFFNRKKKKAYTDIHCTKEFIHWDGQKSARDTFLALSPSPTNSIAPCTIHLYPCTLTSLAPDDLPLCSPTGFSACYCWIPDLYQKTECWVLSLTLTPHTDSLPTEMEKTTTAAEMPFMDQAVEFWCN